MLNKSLLLASVSLLLVGTAAVAFPEPLPPPTRSSRAALKSAPAIPLAFEKNSGQASEDILYLANGNGRAVALKADHASMHIKDVPKPFVMRWAGAAKEVEIEALEEMYFTKNYHIGADENAWVNDVHSYGRVRYHEVYPNIDLDFYSLDGKLEYDFIVHPGGDPSQIALRFEGTEAKLDAEGALRLEAVEGAVWHAPPYVYQEDNGERREIRGAFRKGGETFGFDVGEYDQQANLVIDPVFAMVSFVGGTGRDLLLAGLFDSQGDLWVVGQTDSIDLSEKGGGGGTDALLAAYGNNGDDIAQNWEIGALTVFGGSGADSAKDITQGPDGNLFIGGDTNSPNFFEDGPALGSDVWTTREQISEVRFQLIQRLIARRTGVGDQTFGGFVRPCHPATGGAFDTWDPDGNGDDDIFYFGTVNLSGQPPFNNITQLDAETLEILREWHLLPRGNSGQADIGGIGFDPYTGEMIFAGSSNVDLFGANKLGNPGVFKPFVGAVDVSTPPPATFTFPVPADRVTFINDGRGPSTNVFIDNIDLLPFRSSAERVALLRGGTEQRDDGSISGIIDRTDCELGPLGSFVSCLDNERLHTEEDWNYTAMIIDSTLNVVAAGHRFEGLDRRLGLQKINLATGEVYDEVLGTEAGLGFGTTLATSANRAQIAFLGAAEANQGFPIDLNNLQKGFNGGTIDGYIAILDSLQLNPLGVVTAGQFEWAPIVPYALYTAFIDWPRIPGLILPELVDGRFPKEVEGVEVLLNGRPSAITALSRTQINFVAHGDIAVGEDCTLQLSYTDPTTAEVFESNTVTMPTAPTWFNAFEIGGAGAIIHANGVMSQDNPIPDRSAFALFGSGIGTFGNPEIEACDLTPRDEVYNACSSLPALAAVLDDGTEFPITLSFGGPSPGSTPALGQLNGALSNEFWVFCAATTNVEFTITVTDTATNSSGETMTYFNPLGQAAPAITDTRAFATCP